MVVTYGAWIADPAIGGLNADGSSRNLSLFTYREDAGPFSDVVVSRDRKSVFFVTTRPLFYEPWICRTSGSGKGFDIIYRVFGSSAGHPINLAISPDSKRIAFEKALDDFSGELWVVGMDGSNERKLAQTSLNYPESGGIAWGSSRWIYYVGQDNHIWRIDPDTGETSSVTSVPSNYPSINRDANKLVFQVGSYYEPSRSIDMLDLVTGEVTELPLSLADFSRGLCPVFLANDDLIAYAYSVRLDAMAGPQVWVYSRSSGVKNSYVMRSTEAVARIAAPGTR